MKRMVKCVHHAISFGLFDFGLLYCGTLVTKAYKSQVLINYKPYGLFNRPWLTVVRHIVRAQLNKNSSHYGYSLLVYDY